MRVCALVHNGEVERYYNLKTRTLQEKFTVECLGDHDQIAGLLANCRDDRYHKLCYTLRSHKSNKKVKRCRPSA